MRFSSGFKNTKASESEVFVMGNGPSLRKDLDRFGTGLSSCNTIGVNMFAISDDFVKMKPKYYVMLDIGFFLEKTIPRVTEVRDKVLDALRENLKWEMLMCVPVEARNSFFHKKLIDLDLPIKFVFFNRTVVEGLRCVRHCMYSRGWGTPPPQNVLISALMVAIHIGFKKIYFLGADHSWHEELLIDDEGGLEIADRHFYDKKSTNLKVLHPETLQRSRVHDFFGNLARTFRSYHLIEGFANSKGIEIINASSVSYIDAFRRIKLEDLSWDQMRDK